jgi:hypothetical protein
LQPAQLLGSAGAIGGVGGERLLGGDVEAGEQAECLVTVKIVNMTTSFFVEQLQRQERPQRTRGGNHLRAGIFGVGDQAVEVESGQQGDEEEEARDARVERATGFAVQRPTVREFGWFGARTVLARG